MVAKSTSPESLQILEEIGFKDLPSDWEIVRVEDLLSSDRGIAVGVMYPGEHDPLGVPLIKAADLSGDCINERPQTRISQAKHWEYRRTELSGGELLISLVGEVGRCAIVPLAMAGWNAARAVAVLRFREPSDAIFARSVLMSGPLQHLMQAWSTTTVQATLNLKEIRQIPLPWPHQRQRHEISRTLGALDDKIELNRRSNETLEAMARALFKDWFVDFGPVRAKREGRAPHLTPELWSLFPDALDGNENPTGWHLSHIGNEVAVVGGSTPNTKESMFWDGGTNHWATPKDLSRLTTPVLLDTERKITDAAVARISSGLLPIGTVLLSSRAPIGYLAVAEVPTAINQGFIAMICDRELPNLYVLHWCRESMSSILGNANGSTFQEISKSNFRPIPVVVPPKPVTDAFMATASPLYQRIVSNTRENESLTTLRDTLLPKLISGELRVRDAESLVSRTL